MNHIKKAEIVFPEVSDRKLHVQRKITVEAGKQTKVQTDWEIFCEGFTIVTLATIGLLMFFAILAASSK